jgi:hypothetical protein
MLRWRRLVLDVHAWHLEMPFHREVNAIDLAVEMANRTRSLDPSTQFEVYIVLPLGYLLRGQHETHLESAPGVSFWYVTQRTTNPLQFDPIQAISQDILLLARSLTTAEPFFAQLSRIHIMWDAGFVSWGGYWTSGVAPKIQSMGFSEATIKETIIGILRNHTEYGEEQQPVGSVAFCTDPTVPVQT